MIPVADPFITRPRYIGPELRGPADADGFRVKVGRFGDRFYMDPLPGDHIAVACDTVWPSVSTVKRASGNDWSFVALERVAKALDTDKYRNLARWPYPDRYEALKAINKIGLNAAGQRGTNIHLAFDAFLHGAPCPIDDDMPGADYRGAIDQFFNQYQPTLVAAEFVCIHRDLNTAGYGGTADAIIDIDGKKYIVDWKSRGPDSDHGAYPEEAAQVAGYAGAGYIIVEGSTGPERRLMPTLDGGLIVSIKPDGCRIYPVDLDKGFAHWSALHAWWVARQVEREPVGRQWPARKNASGEGLVVDGINEPPSPDATDVEECGIGNDRGLLAASNSSTPVAGGLVSAVPTSPPAETRIVVIGGPWPERIGCTGMVVEGDPKTYPMAGKGKSEVVVKLDHDPLLKPDPGMFDAVETWWSCVYDRSNVEVVRNEALAWASQPAVAPLVPLPANPDEGDNAVFPDGRTRLDDRIRELNELEAKYKALDASDRGWITALVTQAQQAGVSFHTQGGHRTERRYWIIRGLVTLAAAGSTDDDVLRTLVTAARFWIYDFDQRHTTGACVGALNAEQAQRFADLADDYVGTTV